MERTTSSDGTTIAYDRTGRGPAIVVVGGALSDRGAAAELAAQLAPRFTVIAYDRRGRGDSGDVAAYAPEREIEDIGALIAAVDGTAVVFGHSSGGVLALEAARSFPDAIPKLALYEPVFIVDDSRAPLPGDYLERLDGLVAAGRRGDAVEYFMTNGVGEPAESVASFRGEPFWPALEALAHTLPYDARVVEEGMTGDPAPLRRWAGITMPALVMHGSESPPWLQHAARAIAAILPAARLRTLEGQDHGPNAELLGQALEGFLAA
jgi:pimeloyl-ACP methyl ester carboxylesterase